MNFPPTLLADSQRHKGLGHLSKSKPGIALNIFPLINFIIDKVSHISKMNGTNYLLIVSLLTQDAKVLFFLKVK